MFRKLIFLTSCLLLVGLANAATVWNPAANGIVPPATGNWNVAANWTNDVPGVVDNKGVFNVPGAAECVVTDAQTLGDFVQGDGADGGVVRIQNGGSITTTGGWAGIGYNSTANLVVEDGGTMNFGGHSWIGFRAGAVGTVDINGGTVNVAGMFGLGWDAGDGYVNVNDGGLLALSNIHDDGATSIKQASLLSINGTGAVTLPGDFVGVIDAYAAAGLIAGDGVLGAVQAVVADGVTTVTAVHPVVPVTIAVPDAGFDDHVLSAGGYTYIGDGDWPGEGDYIGPWQSAGGDAWIDNGYYVADGDLPAVSGDNKLYGNDGAEDYVYQILDETFIEGATYTLSVWTGSAWSGYADGWWLYFTGEDYNNNLAETSGNGPVGSWEQMSLVYTATAADAGNKIGIKMKGDNYVNFDEVTLSYVAAVWNDVNVATVAELEAAAAAANPGDRINLAAGTYYLTSQIEIKDGVTYKGAGPGLTIIDGNDVTRAFVAWGDRSATNGQVDVNGVGVPNLTGPTYWVLDGLTIQNSVSDANNRQNILGAARDLLNNYEPNTPYTVATAEAENGGITDNPGWFDILSGSADPNNLTDVELQAYLDGNPVGSAGHIVVNGDKDDDGGAVNLDNGAAGTIRNCEFSNNWAVNDGGVIEVNGRAAVAIQNCTFSNNSSDDDGGAISANGSGLAMSIENCEFNSCSNNDGDDGGALFFSGDESTYIVTDSNFTGCISDDDGGVAYANGHDSSYAFSNCTLHLNTCGDEGGALKLSAQRSTVTLTDIIITDNYAGDDAGAVRTDGDDSSYVFTDCSFIGNYCNDDYAAWQHKTDRAELTMTNCEFIGNGIDANGVVVGDDSVLGLDDDDAGPTTFSNCLIAYNACNDDWVMELKAALSLLNCTFIGNESADGSKSMIGVRGRPWNSTGDKDANGDDIDDVITNESIISNCLFINNTTMGPVIGDTHTDVFAPTVINCLFYGNLVANTDNNSLEVGTIDVSAVTDAAQLVVDPAGDYHPVAGSPAIDASDPATATASDIEGTPAVGVRDVGAYEASAN